MESEGNVPPSAIFLDFGASTGRHLPFLCCHEEEEYDSENDVDVPVDELRKTLASLELPMGWGIYAPRTSAMMSNAQAAGRDENWAAFTGWSLTGVGWLLTGLAVSQGAPFWFQLLMKLVNLRSSGVVPKVEEEAKDLEALLEDKLKGVKEDLLDELK